jgi:hypothetical protein
LENLWLIQLPLLLILLIKGLLLDNSFSVHAGQYADETILVDVS